MNRRSIRRCGLSLVEVMIAIAILGTGVVAMITVASNCLAVVRRARYYETARHLLARAEAEHPLQLEEEIEEGTESGEFKGGPAGYKWTREVTVVNEDEDEEDGLYEVKWIVSWSENSMAASEEIVTYMYAPQKKGGTTEGQR